MENTSPKNLAFSVNDLLNQYIKVHNRLIKESTGIMSIFRKIDFQGYVSTISTIQTKLEETIAIIKQQVLKPEVSEDEKEFFSILSNYSSALKKTVELLMDKLVLLNQKANGGEGISFNDLQVIEAQYNESIKTYTSMGEAMNEAYDKLV